MGFEKEKVHTKIVAKCKVAEELGLLLYLKLVDGLFLDLYLRLDSYLLY